MAMNLTVRNKFHCQLLFFVTAILLFTIWLWLKVWLPQHSQLQALQELYSQEQAQLLLIEQYVRKYPEPAKRVVELEKSLQPLRTLLPLQPETGEFLLYLEQAASRNQVQLLSIKPSPFVELAFWGQVPVEVQICGGYFQILAFVRSLANCIRLNTVDGLQMRSMDSSSEVICSLNLKIYFLHN